MSFYGGRPGNSFVIVTSFESVADMVSNFRLGPDYTEVHYDEHVIINTVNKNDPDNGKIYRRGYDYGNLQGGAEYIGTIVGPAGKAPELVMTTVEDVEDIHEEAEHDRYSSDSYTVTNGSLVPGKDGNSYNDAISWAMCSIRNENDEDCTAYLGFVFPYLVTEYTTRVVSPYVDGRYEDTSAVARIDDGTHPFYEKWRIDIPKGIQGDSVGSFGVEVASLDIEPYTGQSDDINNSRMVMTYEFYDYSDYESGDPKKLYFGDYNMIDNITLASDGTLTIEYTHDDEDTFQLNWIADVDVNTSTNQKLHITWADGTEEDIGNPINYIEDMAVNSSNHLLVMYSDPQKQGPILFNDEVGWTDIGQITQHYEYDAGDSVSGLIWTGAGFLEDDGTNTKKLRFSINPTAFIGSAVTTVTVTAGSLSAVTLTGTSTSISRSLSGNTTVTNQLTGLNFVVDTGVASSGSSGTTPALILIIGMALSFGGAS